MSEDKIYPVTEDAKDALINREQYDEMYARSVEDPDAFWAEQAEWFKGAKVNVAYNCLDRHLEKRGDQTAIIWEGDDPGEDRHITYRELHTEVCKFANALKGLGVKKGDRVCIYMQWFLAGSHLKH